MFCEFVGFTAIEVSLCGPAVGVAQSVLAFAVVCVPVVQIAVPVLVAGELPNTAFVTGAGAPVTLCAKSTGCEEPPSPSNIAPHAEAPLIPNASRPAATPATRLRRRRRCLVFISLPFPRITRATRPE